MVILIFKAFVRITSGNNVIVIETGFLLYSYSKNNYDNICTFPNDGSFLNVCSMRIEIGCYAIHKDSFAKLMKMVIASNRVLL